MRRKAGVIPSMAYVIPPGGGKSFNLAEVAVVCYLLEMPVVILTPNHDLANETIENIVKSLVNAVQAEMERQMSSTSSTQEEITKAKASVVHYRGRAPLNKKKGRTDLTCFKHKTPPKLAK